MGDNNTIASALPDLTRVPLGQAPAEVVLARLVPAADQVPVATFNSSIA